MTTRHDRPEPRAAVVASARRGAHVLAALALLGALGCGDATEATSSAVLDDAGAPQASSAAPARASFMSWARADGEGAGLVVRGTGYALPRAAPVETDGRELRFEGKLPYIAQLHRDRGRPVRLEEREDGDDLVWTATPEDVEGARLLTITTLFDDTPVIVALDSFRGRIVLAERPAVGDAPVLASGLVVDGAGAPVGGVVVGAGLRTEGLTYHQPVSTTAEDGSFAVRALVHGVETVALRVRGRWGLARDVVVSPGAVDVELTVQELATLSGSVVVRGIPLGELEIRIRGPGVGLDCARFEDVAPWRIGSGTCTFAAREHFTIAGLIPGAYTVQLYRGASAEPLAGFRDWDVRPPASTLPTLVVDAETREVAVEVRLADGSPAAGAHVWVRDADERGGHGKPLTADGDGRLATQRSAALLEVVGHAPGHDFEFVTSGEDRIVVQLRTLPETPVTLRIPPLRVEVPEDVELAMALQWIAPPTVPRETLWPGDEAGDPRADQDVELPLSLDGVANGTVTTPGWYHVRWSVRRGSRRTLSHPNGPTYVRIDGSGDAVSLSLGELWGLGTSDLGD